MTDYPRLTEVHYPGEAVEDTDGNKIIEVVHGVEYRNHRNNGFNAEVVSNPLIIGMIDLTISYVFDGLVDDESVGLSITKDAAELLITALQNAVDDDAFRTPSAR